MKKLNLKDVLAEGTPKQKALLLIQNEEASQKPEGAFLTEAEQRRLIESERKNKAGIREMQKYLNIAARYQENRFRLYALQENLKKFSARIMSLLTLWELSEKYVEYNNTLLGLIKAPDNKGAKVQHQADVERFIYQYSKGWSLEVKIRKKQDSPELELDLAPLRQSLDSLVAGYSTSLAIAKAFCIASDEFMAAEKAEAFIPEDVRLMLKSFKEPNTDIPEIYRRDSYLDLVQRKGEDDREVRYRAKYAILPAWSEIEPTGLDNAREALSL